MDLRFEVEGVPELSRRLMISADGISDFRTPLRQSGDELLRSFQLNFSERGRLFGGWAPRKPRYKNGVRVDTWPLLEKSGRMRNSFEDTITKNSVTLYNSAPYFAYHQSRMARARLPRRVMMKIDEERKTFIVKAFQAYILSVTRGQR
jgi:phage gpG-like protein